MADKLVKSVGVRLSTEGYDDARLKIEKLAVAADDLGRKRPEIKPQIDSAKTLLEARLLRDGIKKELSGSVMGPSVSSSLTSGAAASSLSGMLTPMTALVAAGVALSPVLVTLGFGTAGFGAAAAGAVAPILKASKATGGLAANFSKLNPEQQSAALALRGLGVAYDKFQKALAPTVLHDFGQAITLAEHGMSNLLPVSQATGAAIGTLLGRLDKEFQSGTWQNFFGWMAKQAGPDMQAVGNVLIALMDDIPPLVRDLQPLAMALLNTTTNALTLVGALAKAGNTVQRFDTSLHQHADALQHSSSTWSLLGHAAGQALGQLVPGIPVVQKLTSSWSKQGTAAKVTAAHNETLAQSITDVMNAEDAALQKQLGYSNSLIQAANDAVTLRTSLRKSKDEIGLHTQKQRDSFSAANTYINDLEQAAKNAIASGQGAKTAASNIQSGLGILDSAKTKNKLYWQEVRTLVGWLDKLRSEGPITETINVLTKGPLKGKPMPLASGGPASGLTLVGERGPELLSVPAGSYVYNNGQTQAMLSGRSGGNSYHITVNVPPGSQREAGRQIVNAIRAFEQGSGHGWRK